MIQCSACQKEFDRSEIYFFPGINETDPKEPICIECKKINPYIGIYCDLCHHYIRKNLVDYNKESPKIFYYDATIFSFEKPLGGNYDHFMICSGCNGEIKDLKKKLSASNS